jgi:hypothetical protein
MGKYELAAEIEIAGAHPTLKNGSLLENKPVPIAYQQRAGSRGGRGRGNMHNNLLL